MFSTINALVLLLVLVAVASEVTTTAAGTTEAALEAADVNTVTAAEVAATAAVAAEDAALAGAVAAADADVEVGWGCFLEDEGLLDPQEEAVEELLDSPVEAAEATKGGGGPDGFSILFSMSVEADGLSGSRLE